MSEDNVFGADSPAQRGSYHIDKYLFGGDKVRQACWIKDATEFGQMFDGKRWWDMYSVPVAAYVEHVGTVQVPSNGEDARTFEVTHGFTRSFSRTTEVSGGVQLEFKGVGVSSEVRVSFQAAQSWNDSTTQKHTRKLVGPGVFYAYQVHILYAHCVMGASEIDYYFEHNKVLPILDADAQVMREDLIYLSSVATDTLVTVLEEASVDPLGWDELQKKVLFEHYSSRKNAGCWRFDFSVNERYPRG